MTTSEPEPLTVWRHLKTNSYYTVIGTSRCSTNGQEDELAVVYVSHERLMVHHRELSEFMDGRFEFVMRTTPIRGARLLIKVRDLGGVV